MIKYTRVLPRDLFNESKLLKCLGQVSLLVHDGLLNLEYSMTEDDEGFEIYQNEDGDLYCNNLNYYFNDIFIPFYSRINSKETYPLYTILNDELIDVLDGTGNFSDKFLLELKTIKKNENII